ncbi:meckelin (Transmembrane protein 67) domain-containing protein [Phthorimaea operculella]|nr:meckelin (Transmembrane protein 67) domain-containing protein [Phthorimaea operculella]
MKQYTTISNYNFLFYAVVFVCCVSVKCIDLPGSCTSNQYYDPGAMLCQTCPANVSMVVSSDGFSCSCAEHSIPIGINKCKPCHATELVSSNGLACVPRRCQSANGKTVCRKCPMDYISVTQNLDGTPQKEVQCVKCARGYRASNNVCVRCESCACAKHEVAVRGKCVPKKFVNERPKDERSTLHTNELGDVVKNEYFCTQNDVLACRTLANSCVRRFYSTDFAGPCRLWIQPKVVAPKGLPKLTLEPTDKDASEISLGRGVDNLHLALAVFTADGGLKIKYHQNDSYSCFLPLKINIGKDFTMDCKLNFSQLEPSLSETMAPFLYVDEILKPLPISLRRTNGDYVQKGSWPSNKFQRYFLVHNSLSSTANMTNTIYLRTLLVKLRIERNKFKSTLLRLHISLEAQYSSKSPLSQSFTTTLRVEHEMPNAGVLRGLEIWGGVLAAFLTLYAIVQWRGNLRRGGLQFSLVPLLAATVADTLYFSAWFSTLHALAAEAGTLGMTLPLSRAEEHMVKVFIYSAVGLKAIKVAWVNYSQCKCDIFFLDWSEYNPPVKEAAVLEKGENWRATTLAREWARLQTVRRASPAYTVALALILFYLMEPWQAYLPGSIVYRWAAASIAWWGAYVVVIATHFLLNRVVGAPIAVLQKVCTSVGLSLLVFQEVYYAHYVHGR